MGNLTESQIDFRDDDGNGLAIQLADGGDITKKASVLAPGDTALAAKGLILFGLNPSNQAVQINVDPTGKLNINNISGTVSLPTGAATSANQTTEITSLQLIDDLPHLNLDSITGAKGMGVMGSDGTVLRWLKVDSNGALQVAPVPSPNTYFDFGDISTSALGTYAVRRTAYTEQTTNAQRSMASSSANDTAVGTGARTVTITYLDQTGAGPFTEVITLNGTAYVNTVNTNICFIEHIYVTTVGSTGSNIGTLTLKAAIAGGGVTIATVSPTDNQVFWAHHYIASGKTMKLTGISCGHDGTTVGSGSLFYLRAQTVGTANQPDIQITDFVRLYGQSSTFSRTYNSPVTVVGPARVVMYAVPETSSTVIYRASFDYSEA